MNEELTEVDIHVSGVLEKFDGEGDNMVLRERIFVEDGQIAKSDYFDEEGNHIKSVEGGKEIGSN